MRRLFTQSRFTQSRTGIRRQGAKAMNSPLKWEVFVSPQVAVITSDLPPGATERRWSPISSTLISGERDAVLGRHIHHHGAKPGACRMGSRKWKEFDHHLCDAWS